MEPFVCESPTQRSGDLQRPVGLGLEAVPQTGCSASAGLMSELREGHGRGRGGHWWPSRLAEG